MKGNEHDILNDEVRGLKALPANAWPDDPENTATALKERRYLSEPLHDDEAKRRMSAMSRRNFLLGGLAGLVGIFGWRWMPDETKANLLRGALHLNEKVSRFFYRPSRLAPEFQSSAVSARRVNGGEGMSEGFDAGSWRLHIRGFGNREFALTLDEIKALPRTEMITELKCIEGWSVIVHWAGVRFSDFVEACFEKAQNGRPYEVSQFVNVSKYVSLVTPDDGYYVGWDIESILHPQTLLAYEMNGEPLRPEHGAPLRLASATKYGIKLIKRIGSVEFTNERPRDFWAEQGYDWYAGH